MTPHSHQDMGWVKTVGEYYTGGNKGHQHAGVANILDGVVDELSKNPERRFALATIGFLEMWWEE